MSALWQDPLSAALTRGLLLHRVCTGLLATAGKAIAGVLIGAKADFRDDSAGLARAEVAKEDAAALAASLGLAYFEVSSVSPSAPYSASITCS